MTYSQELYGAFGVVSALTDRARTGHGTVVRTSLLAALVGVHAFQDTRWTVAGEVPRAMGNHHPAIAPYGAFVTQDGTIQIAIGNDVQWHARAVEPGLDRSRSRPGSTQLTRASRQPAAGSSTDRSITMLETELQARSSAEWLARLAAARVPSGKVRTLDQVYTWEQTRSQGLIINVDHPTLGTVQLPGPPVRLEDLHGRNTARQTHTAPPLRGQHDAHINSWLDTV
ncbi:CoA transferase [Amycolatopsis sp. H20-H5]|uniref:CoA transferase n=1 Tax=Amycolatopsis sp. H20-H5 TaxID=3046309 RepID=UPI002DB7385D|nr:CoA transferase [Amycolatopsis sp. H20-H5]MEC3978003.1 CoA transferase [Amycolatopsis sp. H20-H5]